MVNPDLAGVSPGSPYQGVLRCTGGRCPPIPGMVAFSAATPRILSRKSIGSTARSRCEPLVFTVDLVRASDGSYRGVSSAIPRATEASWNDGVARDCRSLRVERSITLTPLVLPDPVAAGTPAALDPARIIGYRYPDAADTGAEYLPSCTAGWCTLRCPLDGCAATLAFPAAVTRFTIPAVALTSADCGRGTVGFIVETDPKGAVSFTVARATSTATQVCRRPLYLQATPITR